METEHLPHSGLSSTYVVIARESFSEALLCKRELRVLEERFEELEKKDEDEALIFEQAEVAPVAAKMEKYCIIAIVFAALSVEAYIYDYATRKLSDRLVEHLDRLDVVSKWIVIPRLVIGKEIPKNSKAFQLLKQLVRNRNNIVHYKTAIRREGEVLTEKSKLFKQYTFRNELEKHAKQAIDALNELSSIMMRLDPDEYAFAFFGEPGWLGELY